MSTGHTYSGFISIEDVAALSPEVAGAFKVAQATDLSYTQGLEMALLALFTQNQRLRDGLVAAMREMERTGYAIGMKDENIQSVHGNSRGD